MANFQLLTNTAKIISAVVAFFGFLGSSATLALIYDMNRWNGYMRLIFSLTACQILCDMAFFFIPYSIDDDGTEDSPLFVVQLFLFSLGSVSVALWTNLISYTLFVVVMYQKNFNAYKYFNNVRMIVMFPGLVLAILNVIYRDQYYTQLTTTVLWIQILSIIFNITIHIMVSYILREMRDQEVNDAGHINAEDGTRDSSTARYHAGLYKPVQELARRLEYYPIVQIVALSGLVWYFFGYNLAILGPSHNATTRMVAWFTYSILAPSAGIGYFIVFLKVQPYAYTRFVSKLRDFCLLPVDRTISTQSDLYRLSSAASTRSVDLSGGSSGNPAADPTNRNLAMNAELMRATTMLSTTSSSGASDDRNCETMDDDDLILRIDELRKSFIAREDIESSSNPIQDSKSNEL